MTKGMIFCGCSFTWGQGLYYYSKMETLKAPPPFEFIPSYVTDAHKNYMCANRFARLVANHFNTFEILKSSNYGCDEQSLTFLDIIFDRNNNHEFNYTFERYDYSEVGYVIFQTSSFIRNGFKFKIDGVDYFTNLTRDKKDLIDKLILELGFSNIDELYDHFIKDYFNQIKNKFIELEANGVKCTILCWFDDYIKYIEPDEYMNSRFIRLIYDNKEFNTIDELMKYDHNMNIKDDHEFFGNKTPDDSHPSMKCHKVIADSIIKKLENETI